MTTLFLVGGTGFIGRAVVSEALERGFQVRALARSESAASSLRAAGAEPVRGNALEPSWIEEARGADVLIDLVQPPLPNRMSRRAIRRVRDERVAATAAELAALERLPAGERPVYVSISGADDLQPDAGGTISHRSALRSGDSGFAMIGAPVRRLVEGVPHRHRVRALRGHGLRPGQGLRRRLRRGHAQGARRGDRIRENRLPLTHVTDAARALVHLAGLPRGELAGRVFLATDGSDTTQGELFDQTAELMGAKRPRRVPGAIVRVVGGPVAVEAMTFDAHADNSAIRETGFEFRYPSPREGLPPTLEALGALAPGR